MLVLSPFNNSTECQQISCVKSAEIIEAYKVNFDQDVTRIFEGISEIGVYKCPITQLEFYYPFGLDGDSRFYEELSKSDWYYQQERWEHIQVMKYITKGCKVLEIGSGRGAFASKLAAIGGMGYCGLELNMEAVNQAKASLLNVVCEDLKSHLKEHVSFYDVVCSFQVFEHVSSIRQLFEDSISALKPNGLLIIAVPNNDASFLKHNVLYSKYLNMPPHHVNLFTSSSLQNIGKFFKLELVSISNEPIQDMNVDTYLYNMVNKFFLNMTFLTRVFWKLKLHVPLRAIVKVRRQSIKGHTVMAVFRKTVL